MKNSFTPLLFSLVFSVCVNAQIDIEQKIINKTTQRADQKVDNAIDKSLDKVENGATKTKKDKKSKSDNSGDDNSKEKDESADVKSNAPASSQNPPEDMKSYSKFDFVAGEKVVYFTDFSQTAVGDFPANWNTSGSGEVTTNNKAAGKWLKLQNNQIYVPEINTKLPENFTMEFDVIVTGTDKEGASYGSLTTIFGATKPGSENEPLTAGSNLDAYGKSAARVEVSFTDLGSDIGLENVKNDQSAGVSSLLRDDVTKGKTGKVMHFSFTAQKSRLRFYINEKKVADIPKMLPQGDVYDRIYFTMWGFSDEASVNQNVYLGNIRLAVGLPDMRSKLLTEGKLVTRGITFDSGSDKIKPASYGTLKEIATVLKENAAVKVKIVGHTDNDGNAASNLELSKKRALAVKNALSKEFAIDASRLETDGKGQAEPAGPNTSAEGKANNRRVEFIKL